MWEKDWISNKTLISQDEEIRCWFKVSSNRKKVWNIELWLLEELKRICKKHNIRYYADWGTMLWVARHKWFIPWDDDIDIAMFREDYDRFTKVAPKELPNNIKLWENYWWFTKMVNTDTTALWDDNWWDKDFIWGINIDIFPIYYASRYTIINKIKAVILLFLDAVLISQKSYWFISRMKKWKQFFVYPCKFIFKKISCSKIYKIRENISKKLFFKWNKIYTAYCPYRFFPVDVYDKSHNEKFENTTICQPDWYDTYLKILYGDYMKPVIYQWWHHCWYSINKSYKDIIKTFDRNKSNEENYNNCKSLFVL